METAVTAMLQAAGLATHGDAEAEDAEAEAEDATG
jgi:hypothetical protein